MPQFTAYSNNNEATKHTYPFLLEIQSDLLNDLRSTVVIPLVPASKGTGDPISRLSPVVKIDDNDFIALTQQIAGINRNALGKKACDLSAYRAEIFAAVDFMLTGI